MIKKLISILICIAFVVLVCPSTNFVYAEGDEEEETQEETQEETEEETQEDRLQKVIESNNKIQELNKQIAAASKDLKAAQQLASQYKTESENLQVEINELNAKIDSLTGEIDDLTSKIDELTKRIEENEAKVDAINSRVLNRMESSQGQMHFNPFLDFILGAKGFADMLRRTYGVEAIMSKESNDRNELIDVINQLNADKEELEKAKIELEAVKAELDVAKEELLVKQAELKVKLDYYNKIVEETEAEIDRMQNQLESEKRNYSQLKTYLTKEDVMKLPSLAGFYHPLPGSTITGWTWHYGRDGSGSLHLGTDFATREGTAIKAPANGVVLVSYNGCTSRGYLGCTCGGDGNGNGASYGGNQVYLMVSVNNKIYGILFCHMKSTAVERYSTVMAGDVIGYVGSTGSSTGPHCHIEVFYLGDGDMEDLYDTYLTKNYSLSFNCGWGQAAYNSTRCDANGGNAPCRLKPYEVFGS